MHDISPVLAGTYDDPNYAAWRESIKTNAAQGADTATNATAATAATDATSTSKTQDPQFARNGRLDRTGADAGEQPFSFDDFLDLINPLQHIPVVSSVYREATGESINPVSRIAGDILYGAPFGIASAALGGFGAVGDSVIESQTGHDALGTVVAGLFGDDAKKVGNSNPDVQLASAQSPAAMAAASQAPVQLASAVSTAAALSAPASAAAPASATDNTASTAVAANTAAMHFMPLNKNGAGNAGAAAANMQQQNIAMALAQGSHGMRIGNSIYANKMGGSPALATGTATASATPQTPAQRLAAMTGTTPSQSAYAQSPQLAALLSQMTSGKSTNVTASAAPTVASVNNTLAMSANGSSNIAQLASQASAAPSATSSVATTTASAAVPTPTIPDNLSDDPLVLKALGMYRKVGSNTASTGTQVNVTN